MVKRIKKSPIFPWLICILGALFYCYEYFLRVAPSVMVSDLMHSYQIGAAALGNLAAFYYYAYTPMQLPVGVAMDYYGPRRLLIFACVMCALGTYLFGSGSHLWAAQLGRFMVGFGSAFAFVGVLKLATIWLPARFFGVITGSTTTLGLLGAIAGDFVMSELVRMQGWRSTVMMSAITGIVLAVVIGLLMPDTRGRLNRPPQKSQWEALKELGLGVLKLFKNPHIWLNGVIGCALYLPLTAFAEMWGVPYLQAAHHFSATDAPHFNAIVFAGFGIGGPLFGLLSDQIQRRRLPMIIGAIMTVFTISAILYIPDLNRIEISILLFLFGASCSAQILVFAVGRELSPSNLSATAMALTNMLVMIGGVIFQPLVGVLLDYKAKTQSMALLSHTYSIATYQFALALIPMMAIVALILLCVLRETFARSLEQTTEDAHKIQPATMADIEATTTRVA